MSGLNSNAPKEVPLPHPPPAGPGKPETPRIPPPINQVQLAHRAARDALVTLFKGYRDDGAQQLTDRRAAQVLDALATFSAAVALQEIRTHQADVKWGDVTDLDVDHGA